MQGCVSLVTAYILTERGGVILISKRIFARVSMGLTNFLWSGSGKQQFVPMEIIWSDLANSGGVIKLSLFFRNEKCLQFSELKISWNTKGRSTVQWAESLLYFSMLTGSCFILEVGVTSQRNWLLRKSPKYSVFCALTLWGQSWVSVFIVDLKATIRRGFTNITADYQKLRLEIGVGIAAIVFMFIWVTSRMHVTRRLVGRK